MVGLLMDALQCPCSEVSICFRMPLLPYLRSAASAEPYHQTRTRTRHHIYRNYLTTVRSTWYTLPYSRLTFDIASTYKSAQETRPLPNSLLHRRRRHDKVKLHGQTRDNTHQYQFMALPWIAKLPFLGIAGCDSVTAAMHTRLCSSSDLARRRLPETYNAVANGAADTSLSYSVHARESCVKPCRAHLQHFAKAQRAIARQTRPLGWRRRSGTGYLARPSAGRSPVLPDRRR